MTCEHVLNVSFKILFQLERAIRTFQRTRSSFADEGAACHPSGNRVLAPSEHEHLNTQNHGKLG
jgi:hypothetical protein